MIIIVSQRRRFHDLPSVPYSDRELIPIFFGCKSAFAVFVFFSAGITRHVFAFSALNTCQPDKIYLKKVCVCASSSIYINLSLLDIFCLGKNGHYKLDADGTQCDFCLSRSTWL
jgi:hypothetical protein